MAAGALLRDEEDRVLLVEPAYKDYWEIPGGAVEADESPYAAVVREISEELGLALTPGRLLVVDWVPPEPDRTESVCFVFDGGVLGAAAQVTIQMNEQELRSWAWSTPAQARDRLPGLQARRVQAALPTVRD
jgi:8-oxo-dGTP pyrophosphatase MutT (NUDIX family)